MSGRLPPAGCEVYRGSAGGGIEQPASSQSPPNSASSPIRKRDCKSKTEWSAWSAFELSISPPPESLACPASCFNPGPKPSARLPSAVDDPLALTSTVPLKKSFWPLADNCAISPVVAGEFDAASGPRRSKLCPRADSALLFIRLGLQTQSLTFEVH